MTDFSKTLFRCSSIGHIMTDPRSNADKAAGNLSESCKTHLIDIYVARKYNRQTDIQNRYIQKGLMVEDDSITLYSRVKQKFFKKNILQLSNEFIQGTPDMFDGPEIKKAELIVEVKSSWDIFTFFRVHTKEINLDYWWQCQGYMALSGAKKAVLSYCLVNTPEIIINDEKRKLFYKMGVATDENTDYILACEELDRLMKYDDIPLSERVIEYEINRSDEDIKRLYEKVKKCRKYLVELEKTLHPTWLLAEHKDELKATIIEKA